MKSQNSIFFIYLQIKTLITHSFCTQVPFAVISYPDLSSDYLNFKFDFGLQKSVDPFAKKIKESMIEDCKNLRNSNFYKIDPSAEESSKTWKNPKLDSSILSFERKGLKYERKTVLVIQFKYGDSVTLTDDQKIVNGAKPEDDENLAETDTKSLDDEKSNVGGPIDADAGQSSEDDHHADLFRCVRFANDKYFYISYGFNDDFMYVFGNPKAAATSQGKNDIEFIGRIEPKPILDGGFRNIDDVSKLFAHIVNNFGGSNAPSVPAEEDALCSLNASQQFRLCCSIDDARLVIPTSDDVHQVPLLRVERSFQEYSHRCLTNKIIYLKGRGKGTKSTPPQYQFERINANIIPCFKENDPLFYVTADPSDENAVFTLLKIPEEPNAAIKEEMFVPDGRYRNVSVLKYRKVIY